MTTTFILTLLVTLAVAFVVTTVVLVIKMRELEKDLTDLWWDNKEVELNLKRCIFLERFNSSDDTEKYSKNFIYKLMEKDAFYYFPGLEMDESSFAKTMGYDGYKVVRKEKTDGTCDITILPKKTTKKTTTKTKKENN